MKKTLLALLLLLAITGFVACGNENKNLPSISDPDGDYFTVVDGTVTYSATRSDIYRRLKDQVGNTVLLDLLDTDLLKATAKGISNYWDAITAEEVQTAIDTAVFPSGKDELTEAEIDEAYQDHFDDLYENYGLIGTVEINDYYHLTLSKKLYVKDLIREQYSEEDFTDAEYQNQYNNNYKTNYEAIIVTYPTQKTLDDALTLIGIKIESGVWMKTLDDSVLTEQEIVKAFIDLYNNQNAHEVENYPVETLGLAEGTEYTTTAGVIAFNSENIDELHFEYADINNIQSSLLGALSILESYPTSGFYTNVPKVYGNGSEYTLVLEIGEHRDLFDDVKAEIREKLITAAATNSVITSKMIALRAEHGFIIYDNEIEAAYVTSVETAKLTHETTKKTNATIVAKTDLKSYSADDLFAAMNRKYGISVSISELDYLRFVNDTDLNTIYNIKTGEILNQTEWDIIVQQVEDEKNNLESDVYAEYGYDKDYGWQNFMEDIYGVSSEQELLEYYLYLEIRDTFTASLGDLTDATAESPLWLFYEAQMNGIVDKYYSVKGVHLLIASYDDEGTMIEPTDWTANQIAMAEELNREIMEYLATETEGTYSTRLQALELAFNKAPFFAASKDQTTAAQDIFPGIDYAFKGIEISKYKTAGLTVLYQDLGAFASGSMVEEFDDAVRTVWQADPDSTTPTVYGLTADEFGTWSYIVTKYGYHVYVNLESYALAAWEAGKFIPTLAQIQLYLEDDESDSLTTAQIAAITKYFTPIKTELTGTANVAVACYEGMKELAITFAMDTFTNADFIKQLDLKIATNLESLTYK